MWSPYLPDGGRGIVIFTVWRHSTFEHWPACIDPVAWRALPAPALVLCLLGLISELGTSSLAEENKNSCIPWSRFSTLQKYTKESQTGLEETVIFPCSEKYYSRESSGGSHTWVHRCENGWVAVEAWYMLNTDQPWGRKAKWNESIREKTVCCST